MDNFLDFLNSAEISELIKLSDIDKAMAERIIAARPFESESDLSSVSGLGEKNLEKLKEAFEKLDQIIFVSNQTPARVPEKVTNTNATITIKTDAPQQKEEPKKPHGVGHYVKRFFQILMVILLILAILGGIGAAFYYGVPYFYDKVVKPIEVNTVQISQVATQQAGDLTGMQTEIVTLQNQIDDLLSRSENYQMSISAHSESISQLQNIQSDLNLTMTQQNSQLTNELDLQRAALLNTMQYDLTITRAIQYLSRANLYLSQSNYGLARDDIQAAYSILVNYQKTASQDKAAFVDLVSTRLEMAVNNLPTYPVIASNDLQIAWQYLADEGTAIDRIPVPQYTLTPIPSPTPTAYVPMEPIGGSPTPISPPIFPTPTPN